MILISLKGGICIKKKKFGSILGGLATIRSQINHEVEYPGGRKKIWCKKSNEFFYHYGYVLSMKLNNYLTVDVEDYYQVSAFEDFISKEDWNSYSSRVVPNTKNILSLLDKHNVKATFFVLGWTANKYPQLVKDIADKGHEISCHSYYHRLVYDLTPNEFREDTKQSKDILEQITGREVIGYRAPSYSITKKSLWALDILEELGFKYDSSIFPIYHDRYGIPDAPRFMHTLPISSQLH